MLVTKFQIQVLYNGVGRPLEVSTDERIAEVLQRAIRLFSITGGPHLLSLFTTDGTKLDEHLTVDQAHVHADEQLLLRPDVVKGG